MNYQRMVADIIRTMRVNTFCLMMNKNKTVWT